MTGDEDPGARLIGSALTSTTLPSTPVNDLPRIDLPHVHSGKVRDIYDAGDGSC